MVGFRSRVGLQRIGKNVKPSQAEYTRSIRDQMKAIEDKFTGFCETARNVTQGVLRDALTPTFEKAIKYTPLDSGDLVESGYLEVKGRGKNIQAEVGFGKGGKPFYAVYVHERTDLAHKAPTRSKFLQAALEEDIGKFLSRIKSSYKKRLKI